jgi:uncharacterized protein
MASTRSRIAGRLRTARRAAGLTQAAVAKELGVHRPAITEIEAARRSVSAEELDALARLYRVPVSALLSSEATPERGAHSGRPRSPDPLGSGWIERMAEVVVERFRPERVILFGSHARGTAGRESDVDLLVVMEVEGSIRRKAAEIGAALCRFPVAKDIIVTTPGEFAWRSEVAGTIERAAVRDGKVLFVRG